MSVSIHPLSQHVAKICIASMCIILFQACSEKHIELAEYDGGQVDEQEFMNHYLKYLTVTGIKDNLPDRKKMLRSVVHEELILKDWHSKSLDKDPTVKLMLRRQEEQAILDAWWQKKSVVEHEPSAQDLARMLINERTRYHLQESVQPDLKSALNKQTQWFHENLENQVSDLGFVSLEDIHPRLAAVLYTLSEGEISAPIRMGSGYRLIKLIEKKPPLFIRPREFTVARQRLTQEWQVAQSDSIINEVTRAALASLEITFYDAGRSALLRILHQNPKSALQNLLVESSEAQLPVCRTINGDWTVEMLAPHIEDSKPEHLKAVQDSADIEKFIAGILVRRKFIAEARNAGLHKADLTADAIKKRQDLWRIKTWQKHFADRVEIDQSYLKQFNQTMSDTVLMRPVRNVEFLVFQNTQSAEETYRKLMQGRPPVESMLSRIEPGSGLPGDGKLGWVDADEMGQAAGLVFSQELNTWTKPWNYGEKSYLFRSIAEKHKSFSLEINSEDLESEVRAAGALAQLQKALLLMEKDNHVRINEERIKNIPYIQSPGVTNES